jgi:hypothetical protein
MKTTLKDWLRLYKRLESKMAENAVEDRIQFARAFAATPDERWEMNVNCIAALGFGWPVRSIRELERRKRELLRLEGPHLWPLRRSNTEIRQGRLFGTKAIKAICADRKS